MWLTIHLHIFLVVTRNNFGGQGCSFPVDGTLRLSLKKQADRYKALGSWYVKNRAKFGEHQLGWLKY